MRKDIAVKVAEGELPVARFQADSGTKPRAVVLLIPAIFGVDDVTTQHAHNLIGEGATVYALDSFWRRYPGAMGQSDADREIAFKRMVDIKDSECDGDVAALAAYIRVQHPNTKLVVLGICFGGRPSVRAALGGHVDAVASWHGIRIGELSDELPSLDCPASLQFGEVDALVPTPELNLIRAALPDRADVRMQVHAGCDHGFTHFGRPVFQPSAYETAWAGLCELLGSS